jgi:GAF domain
VNEFLEGRRTPFVVGSTEVRERFWPADDAVVARAFACAPLPAGHGVRGWISIRQPDGDLSVFTDDRLRLLDGMAYRLSMALQKSALYREQRESAQVANALLDFARALAEEADPERVRERVVERTAAILGVSEASLWLQEARGGDIRAAAICGVPPEVRRRALEFRYDAGTSARFVDGSEPFVYVPAEHPDVPSFRDDAGSGLVFAIAPFRFGGDRMGFLIAGAPEEASFDELTLRLLAGLADQAKLTL